MFRKFLALSVLLLGTAGFASAESFDFTYSYTGPGEPTEAVSGTLITTEESSGEYLITGITGMLNGTEITSILGNFGGNDNLLFYPGDPGYLDFEGFSFAAGGVDYNLYYTTANGGQYGLDAYTFSEVSSDFTLTPLTTSPTPEPDSLLLLGTGVLALLGAGRIKRHARA